MPPVTSLTAAQILAPTRTPPHGSASYHSPYNSTPATAHSDSYPLAPRLQPQSQSQAAASFSASRGISGTAKFHVWPPHAAPGLGSRQISRSSPYAAPGPGTGQFSPGVAPVVPGTGQSLSVASGPPGTRHFPPQPTPGPPSFANPFAGGVAQPYREPNAPWRGEQPLPPVGREVRRFSPPPELCRYSLPAWALAPNRQTTDSNPGLGSDGNGQEPLRSPSPINDQVPLVAYHHHNWPLLKVPASENGVIPASSPQNHLQVQRTGSGTMLQQPDPRSEQRSFSMPTPGSYQSNGPVKIANDAEVMNQGRRSSDIHALTSKRPALSQEEHVMQHKKLRLATTKGEAPSVLHRNGNTRDNPVILFDITDEDEGERITFSDSSKGTTHSAIVDLLRPEEQEAESPDPGTPQEAETDAPPTDFRQNWSTEEDALLIKLRENGFSNADAVPYFRGRTTAALNVRYFKLMNMARDYANGLPQPGHGAKWAYGPRAWSVEEDARLKSMREAKVPWRDMLSSFQDRSQNSLKSRYMALQQQRQPAAAREANRAAARTATQAKASTPAGSDVKNSIEDGVFVNSGQPKPSQYHPSAPPKTSKSRVPRRPGIENAVFVNPAQRNSSIGHPSAPTKALDLSVPKPQVTIDITGENASSALISNPATQRSLGTNDVARQNAQIAPISNPAISGSQYSKSSSTIPTDWLNGADRLVVPERRYAKYTPEEDALMHRMREGGASWSEIITHFPGRSMGALQTHYVTSVKYAMSPSEPMHSPSPALQSSAHSLAMNPSSSSSGRQRRARQSNVREGFVSWADIKRARRASAMSTPSILEPDVQQEVDEGEEVGYLHSRDETRTQSMEVDREAQQCDAHCKEDSAFPINLPRSLRQRELGLSGPRAWNAPSRPVFDNLKNDIFQHYQLDGFYQGTSGDVTSLTWSPDANHFAAGSIAITDEGSMQYNMSRNLILGNLHREEILELPDHHIPRPVIDTQNVNALHAMRESQDPRLFMTVTGTQFSADTKRLYTAGHDKKVRMYSMKGGLRDVGPEYSINHPAAVTLLAVNDANIVATACQQASNSINVYRCGDTTYDHLTTISFVQKDAETSCPVLPSALKWGKAPQHQHLLLAGFGAGDEEGGAAGGTILWNANTQYKAQLQTPNRDVYDLAWNPNPSSSSVMFAIASKAGHGGVVRGMNSVVQCFDAEGRTAMEWECPALDINDVVFCPYDSHLIAAGATDGKVYIWDQRFVKRSFRPLHILSHDASLNVLPHDRSNELADTGVQFLSWGPTKSRLYSGSSDGVVRTWNPYRSVHNAEAGEIALPPSSRSAIMSGNFSPDFRDLLIGTENGRINRFSIAPQSVPTTQTRQYKLLSLSQPEPPRDKNPYEAAHELLRTGQIEIKPCGEMPFRQAVQGPKYQGLEQNKLHPKQMMAVTGEYFSAINERDNARREAAKNPNSSHSAAALSALETRVAKAQDKFDELERLREWFLVYARPVARVFQETMRMNEKIQLVNNIVNGAHRNNYRQLCRLDCAVLRSSEQGDPDSGRSVERIPGILRLLGRPILEDDLSDVHLPSNLPLRIKPKPPSLRPSTPARKSIKATLQQAGLFAKCSLCAGPTQIIPSPDSNSSAVNPICARCHFPCFRCAQPAQISSAADLLHCPACELSWHIGVLGYDLVTSPAPRGKKPHQPRLKVGVDSAVDEDSCASELLEHYFLS